MATVTVPAEFFRGELRVYNDWREALARELLQNSCDANPTRIDVRFTNDGNNGVIEFTDDGDGMSRDILEEVFFALGKTTKTGPDSVGGFGRARIITCFAQTRYTIRTRNLMVEGTGGEYTITETSEFVHGCVFTITLLDSDHDMVERAFKQLLAKCSLQVPVYMDGQRVAHRELPARAVRILRDTQGKEWAKVYVMPGSYGGIQLSVKGLFMFGRWCVGDETIVVELAPARSREVLSASRDTLHTEFGEQLDAFVTALSQNRRNALRPVTEPLDIHIGSGGFIATDAELVATQEFERPDTPQVPLTSDGAVMKVVPGNTAAFRNLSLGGYAARPEVTELGGSPATDSLPPLGFDVFLMADHNDARTRKLATAWNPTNWDKATGRRRRQLLLTWKTACEVGVDALVAARPDLGRVLWTVGWTFDPDVGAIHRAHGDGHVFALNPVDPAGRAAFRVSDRADRRIILARALHEVSHVVSHDHDEGFSSVLTQLFGAVDPIEADRRMRSAQ